MIFSIRRLILSTDPVKLEIKEVFEGNFEIVIYRGESIEFLTDGFDTEEEAIQEFTNLAELFTEASQYYVENIKKG